MFPTLRHILQRPHVRSFASKQGLLRGTDIPYTVVRLRDPETGKLSDFQSLRRILASINSQSHYVQLVADKPEPIVKICDRYAEMNRALNAQRKEREAARKNITKEVQVSWFAAPPDFAHKLDKVREELSRGARVDLVFSRKSEQPRISEQNMAIRAAEVLESLADVAKEWKASEIRPRQGVYAMFLESTGTTTSNTTTAVDVDTTTMEKESTPAGKKITVPPDITPKDIDDMVRRVGKEFAKGGRVELVLSAKKHAEVNDDAPRTELQPLADKLLNPLKVEQDDATLKRELGLRASKLLKVLKSIAQEWTDRRYQANVAKLTLFLEPKGGLVKGKKVVIHKPKPKKIKDSDIPDLYQD